MKKIFSKNNWFLSTLFLYLILGSNQLSAVTLNGNILLEGQTKTATFNVVANGVATAIEENRSFSIELPAAKLYRIKISADGYYPSYQTFSHYELEYLASAHSPAAFSLPEVSLVKRKENRVMFAFGGDVMMARRYSKPYFGEPVLIKKESINEDTKNLVRHVKPYMELADFSAVNLETQIVEQVPIHRAPKSVTFYSPPETLEALQWAGIDYVTLGNNHIFDYLDEGLISTLKFMGKSEIAYSGAGLNQQQALEPHYESLSGNDYAMLGFVGWKGGFSPHQAAGPEKGGAGLGTEENIVKTVSAASEKGYPTIVQYHGGLEYHKEPSRMAESRLKMAIDHGADLVVAHHPHVTQGLEIYKGKLIAYSLGNFVFDQYYYATPLSYILYVWMDGGEFHRAEIIPIYLKGYVPAPATGIQRNALTKRIMTLSRSKGVSFDRSGGHLVLHNKRSQPQHQQQTIVFDALETVKELYSFPVSGMVTRIESDGENANYRLGENLLNGGDFESYDLFTSRERGWLLDGADVSNNAAFTGRSSVAVTISKKHSSVVGMKMFRRVFNYANPMTYQARILNRQSPVKARLYIQFRGNSEKLFDALENGKKTLLNETVINPMEDWQNYQIDFNTPRVGYRSYRLLLELTSATDDVSDDQIVHLDNIALIQWQAHYNAMNKLPRDSSMPGLATHIGLATAQEHQQKITIHY